MPDKVHYRPIEPEDSSMLAALIATSPSTGAIGFTYDYLADFMQINKAFASDLHGIVAVSDAKIVGMVLGERVKIQLEGQTCDAAYISNLYVHPDYRRKGIARKMAEVGFQYIGNIFGSNLALYAAVVENNISMGLIQSYRFQSTHQIQGGIVPMRRIPVREKLNLVVRTAANDDLEDIANGMNAFYREHNLWRPVTPTSLREFVEMEVAGISPNKLYVVTKRGRIVGGLSLSDQSRLVRMRLEKLPFHIQLLGAVLGVLPKSGILHSLTIRRVWFKDGELNASQYLWQYLRYHLRNRGGCFGIAFDPRDKVADVFQLPFWLPMFNANYTIRTDKEVSTDRFVYCVAGP